MTKEETESKVWGLMRRILTQSYMTHKAPSIHDFVIEPRRHVLFLWSVLCNVEQQRKESCNTARISVVEWFFEDTTIRLSTMGYFLDKSPETPTIRGTWMMLERWATRQQLRENFFLLYPVSWKMTSATMRWTTAVVKGIAKVKFAEYEENFYRMLVVSTLNMDTKAAL